MSVRRSDSMVYMRRWRAVEVGAALRPDTDLATVAAAAALSAP